MDQYRFTRPQPPSSNALFLKPFLLGLALIVLITGFFLIKKNVKEKEAEDVQAKILAESNKEEHVEVQLASCSETYSALSNENFQLVDIREAFEFDLKHLESSINIPLSMINEDIHLIDQSKTVIIIDRTDSVEGRLLTDHLKNEGLKVKYLEGGIVNFAEQGFPLITKGNPASTADLIKVTSLNAAQIREKIFEGELIAFVDTRPKEQFDQDHIFGAVNIPLEELERRKKDLPRRIIVLYDNDPLRSFRAAVLLYDMSVFGAYNSLDDFETLKQDFERN